MELWKARLKHTYIRVYVRTNNIYQKTENENLADQNFKYDRNNFLQNYILLKLLIKRIQKFFHSSSRVKVLFK